VEHTSVSDNFFPMFAFGRHEYPWGEIDKKQTTIWHSHSTSTPLPETIQNFAKMSALRRAGRARRAYLSL
jgi:hypothetical protein